MAVRTWVWVVVGLAVAALLVLLALTAAGVYFVARQIETEPASRTSATEAFEQARARFADERPLIEIDETDHTVHSRFDPNRPPSAAKPETMHVLAWDPEDERLARVAIPFWLLRLGQRGSFRFSSGADFDFERLNISVSDLERYGPTLLVDHESRQGERVLIWTQ